MIGKNVYVSITGLKIKRAIDLPLFWWHAVRSMKQAQQTRGNISAEARMINGIHHTLSIWESRDQMLVFLHSPAHRKAMHIFDRIATGKIFGMTTSEIPDWSVVPVIWHKQGRDVWRISSRRVIHPKCT